MPRNAVHDTDKQKLLENDPSKTWRRRWHRVQNFCAAIVESKYVVITTTVMTLYALTSDDLRLGTTNLPQDAVFNYITLVVFVVFFTEIILSCIGKPDYFGGFFFNLDIISTISLVIDITWVNDWIANVLVGGEEDYQVGNSSTARLGARATRVVRVLRLVRILKLYKAILDARAKKNKKQRDVEEWDEEDADDEVQVTVESDLAKSMSDLTTRRVVVLIILMMLVYPLLAADEALQYPTSEDYGMNLVNEHFLNMEANPAKRPQYENSVLRFIYFHNWFMSRDMLCADNEVSCPAEHMQHIFWMGISLGDSSTDEARLKALANNASLSPGAVDRFEAKRPKDPWYGYGVVPPAAKKVLESKWKLECRSTSNRLRLGLTFINPDTVPADGYIAKCPEDLRGSERKRVVAKLVDAKSYKDWHFAFYLDRRIATRTEAMENFIRTGFICVLLLVASAQFSHDASLLVLKPIELMITKVQLIAKNPLCAAKLTDAAFKAEEIERAKQAKAEGKKQGTWKGRVKELQNIIFCSGGAEQEKQPNETVTLEKTIVKLGALLALGFGEAGVSVISHNMKGSSANVDAMVPGQRVDCIIGSTHMGNFSTFTEVLQGRVMTFVNQVAEVIHGVVYAFHGAPSRTSGDSFLVVWALRDNSEAAVSRMADMSVFAFAVVLAGINRSNVLASYRTHPGLQQRLGRRLRVSVTFGLHLGWTIEGALGSEFKIDATYVSPNVNIAEQVERAAEVYGTSILCTSDLHTHLTEDMSHKCRIIDRVKIRGSPTPMDLYSVDMNHITLTVESPLEGVRWNTRQRFRARQFLEAERSKRLEPDVSICQAFSEDPNLAQMTAPYTVSFREVFGMGYQNYVQGEWKTAQRLLSRTWMQLSFEDGPSAALLRFMALHNYNAPANWKGFHNLEDMPSRQSGPHAQKSKARV